LTFKRRTRSVAPARGDIGVVGTMSYAIAFYVLAERL
jgi:hypothetical protein